MNVLLWVLQAFLAFLSLGGGSYKVFAFDQVAGEPWFAALPRAAWSGLGVFEMICGVLLIVPAATKWMPILTPIAAAAILVENLALAALYGRYSLKLTAANPLVWVLAGAAFAAVIAWGRYALRPAA